MSSNVREWLAKSKKRGMELGLERVHAAHQSLIQDSYAATIIHIAGSNGKGTLCATLAAHLYSLDHSTVMFTSPHLIRTEERIRINGKPITAQKFDEFLSEIHTVESSLNMELTFFEITFLVSCLCAHRNNIDFFIVETGLGGRYDATRILPADIGVLTSLSLEHRDVLGNTLADIAAEKAAIARPGKPLIALHVNDSNAIDAIEYEVDNAGRIELGEVKQTALLQWVNVGEEDSIAREAFLLAQATLQALNVDASGLDGSVEKLNWPGRFQEITTLWNGSILCDAAHNPSGLEKILPLLQDRIDQYRSWTLVFGCTPQYDLVAFSKPIVEICNQNPPQDIILTKPQFGRHAAVSLDTLRELDWSRSSTIHECEDAAESNALLHELRPNFTVIIGSLYLIGEIYDTMGLWDTEYMELFPAKTQRDEP